MLELLWSSYSDEEDKLRTKANMLRTSDKKELGSFNTVAPQIHLRVTYRSRDWIREADRWERQKIRIYYRKSTLHNCGYWWRSPCQAVLSVSGGGPEVALGQLCQQSGRRAAQGVWVNWNSCLSQGVQSPRRGWPAMEAGVCCYVAAHMPGQDSEAEEGN